MTYKALVRNGAIPLPPDAVIEDGTEVEITIRPKGATLGQLLKHAGTWHGTDADDVVESIYRSRSSRNVEILR
jgi:hypothetical protein